MNQLNPTAKKRLHAYSTEWLSSMFLPTFTFLHQSILYGTTNTYKQMKISFHNY